MRNKSILIVEKNPVIQMVNHCLISSLGYQVDVACDEDTVIRGFEYKKYDLIFLDIDTNKTNFYKLYKFIREKSKILPIIGMSCYANKEKCLSVGINDFVKKPAGKAVFKNILDTWLK